MKASSSGCYVLGRPEFLVASESRDACGSPGANGFDNWREVDWQSSRTSPQPQTARWPYKLDD